MHKHQWGKLSLKALGLSAIHFIQALWCFCVFVFWLPFNGFKK